MRSKGKALLAVLMFAFAVIAYLGAHWVWVLPSAVPQPAIGTPRTIRVALDSAYPPYSFRSDEGKLQGILIDQWLAWEKKTGIKVEFHAMDWGEVVERMRAGEFDVIGSIVETPARREYFDFSPTFATMEVPIFFRKDISGITDLASLKGFPVGVKMGDQHIDILKANGVTTLIPFQNHAAIVSAAKEHKINVFVFDGPSANYFLNKQGIDSDFRQSAPIFRDELRRAVRKGDTAMLRTASEGFAAITPDELKRIDEKWYGRTINRIGRYLTYASYAVAAALLIIAGLTAWNRTLRRKVLQRTAALSESEQRFRRLVELMPVAVYVCDKAGIIQSYNNRAVELWGREPKPGDTAQPYCGSLRLYSPDGKLVPHEESKMAEVLRTGVQARDLEVVIERPDGSRITVLVNIAPLRNGDGELIGALNCFQDITERRSAEWELKKEKEILAKVFDNIPVMIGFVGDDGGIKLVNPEWERTIGWTLKEVQEQNVDIFAEAYPDPSYRQKVLDFVAASTGEWADLKIKVRDGRVIDVACAVVHLSDGTKVAIAQDITERKQAEEKLKATSEQLRALSARLQSVREEEATRIAREIHDELGQKLTGLKMDLRRAERKLEELEGSPAVNTVLDTIVSTTELADEIITAVQEIAANLRPGVLDKLGLGAALHYEARRLQERTGILCEVCLPETDPNLSPEISTTLFRIFQECLTNIARHAHATKVEAMLKLEDEWVKLRVQDDGQGITDAEITNAESLGLLGMKERTALLGGEIVFEHGPQGGTIVIVSIPQSGASVQRREAT